MPDAILHAVHPGAIARGDIVMAVQVEQAMDDVKREFLDDPVAMLGRAAFRGIGAHDQLAVIKGDHIGRAWHFHELPMHACDDCIAHHRHFHEREPLQRKLPIAGLPLAFCKRKVGKTAKARDVETDATLPVDEINLHSTRVPFRVRTASVFANTLLAKPEIEGKV